MSNRNLILNLNISGKGATVKRGGKVSAEQLKLNALRLRLS